MLNEDGNIEGQIHPEEEDSPTRGQVCSFAFYCMKIFLT